MSLYCKTPKRYVFCISNVDGARVRMQRRPPQPSNLQRKHYGLAEGTSNCRAPRSNRLPGSTTGIGKIYRIAICINVLVQGLRIGR